MLKRKKKNTQAEWLDAYCKIREYMETPKGVHEAEVLIEIALERILPLGASHCVYAWSGGKDAIALQVICEEAGIHNCGLGTIGERWEYPTFWEHVRLHAPEGLKIIDFGITPEFLNEHPNYVFPENSRDNYYWFRACNQRLFATYADEMNADYILMGHRVQDGNKCHDRKDKRQITPLHDFTHEDVFKIMAYGKKELPPIYYMPDGFNQGTHAWPMRFGGDKELETLWQIDKNILLNNQELDKVRKFVEEKDEGH